MSTAARRHSTLHVTAVAAPKVRTDEDRSRLPLLDRLLQQEHQRHANRLAEIRRVADKLPELDAIVQAAQADGAAIQLIGVRQGFRSHYSTPAETGRSFRAVVLNPIDNALSEWRKGAQQNAVASALLAAGWRVVDVHADGPPISRDSLTFMRGRRAVETTCMRQWVLDAIEVGHITAATPGKHPATDTGAPLNTGRASEGNATAARPH